MVDNRMKICEKSKKVNILFVLSQYTPNVAANYYLLPFCYCLAERMKREGGLCCYGQEIR